MFAPGPPKSGRHLLTPLSTHAHAHARATPPSPAVEEDDDGWVVVHEEGAPERRGLVPASYIHRDV